MIYLCLLLHLFYDFSRNCLFREQNWQLSNIVNDFGNSNFFTAVHFHSHGCLYFGEGQHEQGGGQLLFYVLKQVECRQKLLREPQYKLFLQKLLWTRPFDPPPLKTCPNFCSLKSWPALLTPPPFATCPKFRSFFFEGSPK